MRVMKGGTSLRSERGSKMPKTQTIEPEVTPEPAPESEVTTATITPAAFALMVGSDPKTIRRFLRSLTTNKAGKGGRWAIPLDAVDELKTRWEARGASQTMTFTPKADAATDELEQDAVELEEEIDLDDIDEL